MAHIATDHSGQPLFGKASDAQALYLGLVVGDTDRSVLTSAAWTAHLRLSGVNRLRHYRVVFAPASCRMAGASTSHCRRPVHD